MAQATAYEQPNSWLRGVTAAMLTPRQHDGTVSYAAAVDYSRALAKAGIDALAVGVHTGRGMFLSDQEHTELVEIVKASTGVPVVAGACGTLIDGDDPRDWSRAVIRRASALGRAGADALLVYPPPQTDPSSRVGTVETHAQVAEASGCDVIPFMLYDEAGTSLYDLDTIEALCELSAVVGVKIATLYDAVLTQEAIRVVHAADRLAFSGEDRMLGASLMWGADGLLVGIAAARPELTLDVLRAWQRGEADVFVAASNALDRFASITFREPFDGYVQRLGWVAAADGLLSETEAVDRYVPVGLESRERFDADLATRI